MHELWSQILWFWQAMRWRDIVDILIVAFLIYQVLRLVHGTRAVQMGAGLGLVALLYELSRWFELTTVQWLLRNAVVYLGFAIIVLFQHEIRAALIHLGKSIRATVFTPRKRDNPFGLHWYDEVVLAVKTLASERTGALLVFERDVGLRQFVEGGIRLDARLTYDLLVTIFNTNTPLHDGAVIISNDRVAAASCFLPLTQNPVVSRELGTRHRAAIGITEDSDAFAVVVSEETGKISFAAGGELKRGLDLPGLRRLIQQAMEPWHSDEESAAQEHEERQSQRAFEEIIASARHDSSRRAQGESVPEG